MKVGGNLSPLILYRHARCHLKHCDFYLFNSSHFCFQENIEGNVSHSLFQVDNDTDVDVYRSKGRHGKIYEVGLFFSYSRKKKTITINKGQNIPRNLRIDFKSHWQNISTHWSFLVFYSYCSYCRCWLWWWCCNSCCSSSCYYYWGSYFVFGCCYCFCCCSLQLQCMHIYFFL